MVFLDTASKTTYISNKGISAFYTKFFITSNMDVDMTVFKNINLIL